MRKLVVDIEGNGLLKPTDTTPAVDRIHSLVIRDQDTKQIIMSCAQTFLPDNAGYPTIESGLKYLMECDPSSTLVVIHNGIGYDYPALQKIYPWFKLENVEQRLMDTLVIAGMLWAHLHASDMKLVANRRLDAKLRGSQSLKAWGYRLGCHKGEYTGGWDRWSKEMQDYCEQDTMTLAVLADFIQAEMNSRAKQDQAGAVEAVETELELAWYLFRQEENGWPFDMDKAQRLYAQLAGRRAQLTEELRAEIKPWLKPVRYKGETVVKTPAKDRKVWKNSANPELPFQYFANASYSELELVEFNPSSRRQIADRLMKVYGWVPTSFSNGGYPEVDEDSLGPLAKKFPAVAKIMEYLVVEKRLGQLAEGKQAWIRNATINTITGCHHTTHRVKQSGTVTHRASHVDFNASQVPAVGSPYGAECRELFMVPPCPICGMKDDPNCPAYEDHFVEIGADQSGLELRMLSHYMARWDDGAYGRAVVEGKNEDGTDVHSKNRDALGLEGKAGRASAKTFIYAFLYGAGDLNLGTQIPPSDAQVDLWRQDKARWKRVQMSLRKRELPDDDATVAAQIQGGELRAKFIKGVPALGSLTDAVKAAATNYGFLLLLDKRRVYVRYKHAALNSLLQGSGAVVCKRWVIAINRRLRAEFGEQGWRNLWSAMGWIHDEVQIAVRRKIAARVMVILVEEARAVGLHYNLRCPTDGEAKIGRNWKDTH